jgi:NDP-sugar pyrophosphorylase family protein
MQIDYCLILAAGFGTRMGSIGHELPKVMWPVFEKSLLELQVAYARSLGIKSIYVNLHYMGENIEKLCRDNPAFSDVVFLWERPDILDIGGAIHNLASQKEINYQGKLLVINADQFFYVTKEELDRLTGIREAVPAILFSYQVKSESGYNALSLDANRFLINIIKNADLKNNELIETYTGMSFIDLVQLRPVKGVSAFFESVCPYREKEVAVVLLDKIDYWDFGTLKRYWQTSFRILDTYRSNSNHPFLRFLVNHRALKTWKIDLQNLTYHAAGKQIINLTQNKISFGSGPAIILKESQLNDYPGKIWWGNISEDIMES